jgi:hypothetical protein
MKRNTIKEVIGKVGVGKESGNFTLNLTIILIILSYFFRYL